MKILSLFPRQTFGQPPWTKREPYTAVLVLCGILMIFEIFELIINDQKKNFWKTLHNTSKVLVWSKVVDQKFAVEKATKFSHLYLDIFAELAGLKNTCTFSTVCPSKIDPTPSLFVKIYKGVSILVGRTLFRSDGRGAAASLNRWNCEMNCQSNAH